MDEVGSRRDEGTGVESAAAIPLGSLGAWLRTQREARGVTLREIADASKISLRHLEALELDRFESLPAPVFVRGFLREYARVVGLDPDEAINLYLMAAEEHRPEEAAEESRVRPSDRVAPSPVGYGLLVAAVIVVLLAIAAAVSYWVGRRSEPAGALGGSDVASASASSTEEAGASGPEVPAVATADAGPLVDGGEAPPAAGFESAPGRDEASHAAAAPAGASAAATGAEPRGAFKVELEFLQDCWVEVVVDGKRRPSELKAGGEVLLLEPDESVVLTLGNAPAVRVAVDGEPLPLPSAGGRVLHGFRIDRSTVAAIRRADGATAP